MTLNFKKLFSIDLENHIRDIVGYRAYTSLNENLNFNSALRLGSLHLM